MLNREVMIASPIPNVNIGVMGILNAITVVVAFLSFGLYEYDLVDGVLCADSGGAVNAALPSGCHNLRQRPRLRPVSYRQTVDLLRGSCRTAAAGRFVENRLCLARRMSDHNRRCFSATSGISGFFVRCPHDVPRG